MSIEEASRRLAAVTSLVECVLTGLETYSPHRKKAQDIVRVFKVCESDLREHSSAEPTLTNTREDLVRSIDRRAKKALHALSHFGRSPALALDRAYANGAEIENDLNLLAASLQAMPFSCQRESGRGEGRQPVGGPSQVPKTASGTSLTDITKKAEIMRVLDLQLSRMCSAVNTEPPLVAIGAGPEGSCQAVCTDGR